VNYSNLFSQSFEDPGVQFILILSFIVPFIIAGIVLLIVIFLFWSYVKAKRAGNKRVARKYRNVIIAIVSIALILTIYGLVRAWWLEYSSEQNVKNVGFTIYGIQDQNNNTSGLQLPRDRSVPHVDSNYLTPLDSISMIQAATDSNTNQLFKPPDLCDIGKLKSYLDVRNKNNPIGEPEVSCVQINTGTSGWTLLAPASQPNPFSLEFVAVKDDTIIIFTVYGGTPEKVAKVYVVEFLHEAIPIDPETLL